MFSHVSSPLPRSQSATYSACALSSNRWTIRIGSPGSRFEKTFFSSPLTRSLFRITEPAPRTMFDVLRKFSSSLKTSASGKSRTKFRRLRMSAPRQE